MFIHTNLESRSEPDGLPLSLPLPPLPKELVPTSPSFVACASSTRPLRAVGNAPTSIQLNPLTFTLILLHFSFFTIVLLPLDLS